MPGLLQCHSGFNSLYAITIFNLNHDLVKYSCEISYLQLADGITFHLVDVFLTELKKVLSTDQVSY